MASRTPITHGGIADSRASVASELDAIFAPLPRPVAGAEVAAPRGTKPRRRGLRPWAIALAVVVLITLIASLTVLQPVIHQPAPAPRPRTTAAPKPTPASAPALEPVAMQDVTPQTPSRPAPVMQAPATPPSPRAAPQVRSRGCPRSASAAWCLRGSTQAADDRLRDAYAAAVRAGVDRDVLVGVRNDWNRLRGRANRDPEALIRGYAELTRTLGAEIDAVSR